MSDSPATLTLRDLNNAAALAEALVAQLPADQQVQGHAVAHAFQYAVALLEEMQRRLRLAEGVFNQLASTAARTGSEVNPASLGLWPPFEAAHHDVNCPKEGTDSCPNA
ncbi:hypothetical protein [Sulfobacillus harzensis]|uniref:Uncharacterized protein n=1 Tax=Sulfobacillus harzensis TaxID=2729629 RepID=A0A7Y0L7E4_9FIRM|nr:hypothetical protein [Sulfobacillus harzensis]NMP24689.1 hypothetical protein [Sulfobacillus harzensis]